MGDILIDNVNSLTMTKDPTLILTQFHHLVIETKTVSEEELASVLDDLPNIISLKLPCLELFQPSDLSEDDDDDDDEDDEVKIQLASVSKTNKIIDVYLEKLNDFKEFDFLLGLCHHAKHLHINSLENINIDALIRKILQRIADDPNQSLRLLCLRIPAADDQLIEKLKKIIDYDARLANYTIKRIMDKIYFQWD